MTAPPAAASLQIQTAIDTSIHSILVTIVISSSVPVIWWRTVEEHSRTAQTRPEPRDGAFDTPDMSYLRYADARLAYVQCKRLRC